MCRSRWSARTSSIRIISPSASSRKRSGCVPASTRRSSPSSAAANARAAARFPTPRGPWKRYAWAGPSVSEARRRRFASGCSGKVSKLSIDRARELLGLLHSVHREDTDREELGELAVGAVDPGDELVVLALDPVRVLAVALARLAGVDEQEDGLVGEQ